MSRLRWLFAALVAVAFAPVSLLAQEPATVSGRVTNASGAPENAVMVRIDALSVGTTTSADGSYRLVVPASRVRAGQQVTITASRVGLASSSRQITLNPGANLTQNFQLGADVLRLGEIVATGQGTATTRARATATVNTVSSQAIEESRENNVVAALAGKAPNVLVTSTSGDPGAGAYIQIRGAASVYGGTQPLFVVDGTPIDNRSTRIEDYANRDPSSGGTTGTTVTNRAADINPADIADIQILKGGAATALYGSRGANGVVLITTKSGRAGQTRVSFNGSYSNDEVNRVVPLQTQYGLGLNTCPTDRTLPCSTTSGSATGVRSWNIALPGSTPVFDHANEVYNTGNHWETNLTLSGGGERTTYYMSVGRLAQDGVIVGPQAYDRTTLRLKGTHQFADNVTVGGNFAYTNGQGDFVQQGSNISGIQLGALRTPPEFNNLPYLDPVTGFHRSYRCSAQSCTGSLENNRGFDNPFWVANEMPNTSSLNRSFGNVNVDYSPASWLRLSYILGADFSSDDRRALFPKSSSDTPEGKVIRANLRNFQIESRFLATMNRNFGDNAVGSLSLGQNLNHSEFNRYQTNAFNLIYGTDQLDFAITKVPDEYKEVTRTDGYFANGELTLWDQLTVSGNLLYEGGSTFGTEQQRFWYPGAGFSWQVSKLPAFDNLSFVDQFKVRANFGVSGRQPPAYVDRSSFNQATLVDGWVQNAGWTTIYNGKDGVQTQGTLGNSAIKPERKTEYEAGFDLGILGGRAALGFTYYNRVTKDMILDVTLPPSSGFTDQFQNAGRVDNHGIELTLDLNPIQRDNFSWSINTQYSRNRSCVKELTGSDFVVLNGFSGTGGSYAALVQPGIDGAECHPFGVFYGGDFVRFGRGEVVGGTDIDATYGGPAGAVFLGSDGFPRLSGTSHVVGDPNPSWTGSIRNTFTLFGNLRVSGLLDISQGGEIWNGTRGALTSYGTHGSTLAWHGAGITTAFGSGFMDQFTYAGPGLGKQVIIDRRWGQAGIGNGFNGPFVQFLEDASFVKLRDVSVSYTIDQPWLKRRFGMSSMNLTLSGRNLKTWTDYTGIDPESNLTGQSVGRGLDYFNNPQTRSWVISVNLNR
ncbi:MAG TPA: SusC/RagA family TonB-linked outer membrane protein [Longimicrobium sp.]